MKLNFQFELTQQQQSKWAEFWSTCKHSYARQHYSYGDIERAKGRIPIYAIGEAGGRFVCIAIFSIRPLFFGKRFSLEAYCLRGPAFDEVSFFKEFMQHAIAKFKKLGVGSIRISPYWQFPRAEAVESALKELKFIPYSKTGYRENTGFISLSDIKDEMIANLPKKTRYNIRRAEKLGVVIQPMSDMNQGLKAFRCLETMRLKRGLIPMSRGEFKGTFEHVFKNQEQGVLLSASLQGEFLAALWVIKGPFIANTPCYAIDVEACNKHVKTLTIGHPLWWKGILWAKQKGCLFLDVEGYNENTDKWSPVHQIHEFKRQLRPEPVEIIPQHVYICNTAIHTVHAGYAFLARLYRFSKSLPYQVKTRHFFRRVAAS